LHRDVWAIVPIKEIVFAKQRLAKALSPARRQELAVAMFEDVMQALSASQGLAGIAVVTLDQTPRKLPRAGKLKCGPTVGVRVTPAQ
jgi:2-phospho-L-lactate guanylyltransferase (CobY/MobA/RfbA family)